MGLDVYVGSLTRYYSGDWQTIVQQLAPQLGMTVRVEHQGEDPNALKDPAQIRPIVLGWRDSLSQALGGNLTRPLDWNEAAEAPYFTDKPAWDCYSDLLMWAAYDEHPELKRPASNVEDVSKDPAYRASNDKAFRSRYPSLLRNVELWLPCDFSFTFTGPDAGGREIAIGSSVKLLAELKALNDRTWNVDAATCSEWRKAGSDHGAPLESGARFAYAIFRELAENSVEHRLPMKLDY